MKKGFFLILFVFFLFPTKFKSQIPAMSGLDKGLVIGNLLMQGYMAIKGNGTKQQADPNAKTVESFCFKNKMDEKITIKLSGKIEDEEVKKNS